METIETAELKQLKQRNEDFELINVLSREAFEEEHIPDSRNIPIGDKDFEEAIRQAVPQPDRRVIVYCADRDCQASPKAAKRLDALGYRNVYDYEGGMKAWKDAGLPVDSGA